MWDKIEGILQATGLSDERTAKLTQDEVAYKAGTSRSYISKLENDTQAIELKTLSKIVEASLGKRLVISIE